MWDTRNIVGAWIERPGSAGELKALGVGENRVVAAVDTGDKVELFQFEEDSLSFELRELVGLTVSLARRMQHERELAYQQS